MTDVLTDLLRALRLNASVIQQATLCGEWALDTSGSGLASFHLVLSGECWLHLGDGESGEAERVVPLGPGDLIVFPRDASHLVSSGRERRPARGTRLPAAAPPVDDPGTGLVCGYFDLAAGAHNPLIAVLPDHLIFRARSGEASSWAHTLTAQVLAEADSNELGSRVVIERLVDLLFIEAIRLHVRSAPGSAGVLAALSDQKLRRVLQAIHAEPARPWTLPQLAEIATMSRSAFAARFSGLLGQAPMEYLRAWRLQLARTWLTEERCSVIDVAVRCGYETETAFTRAFKRMWGTTPSALARRA